MRILGFTVWPESPSDAEYVSSIRRALNRPRIARYGVAVGGVSLLAAVSIGAPLLFKAIAPSDPPSHDESLAHLSVVAALVVGYVLGFFLHSALSAALTTCDLRKGHLLVKCWQELHPEDPWKEASRPSEWTLQPVPVCPLETADRDACTPRRILGMRVRPARLTDEQYIKSAHKMLPKLRVVRYFLNGLGVLMLVILLAVGKSLAGFLVPELAPPGDRVLVYVVYALGAVVGFMIGLLVNVAGLLVVGTADSRGDRLLVKCWDALHPSEQSN
jgi:hypothetical protein